MREEASIDSERNPEAWAALLTQLEDAREHLSELIDKMARQGEIETEDYTVDMGHIYAHLNRAWNSRDCSNAIGSANWNQYSAFPKDLEPVG